jgi:hypothetical protein
MSHRSIPRPQQLARANEPVQPSPLLPLRPPPEPLEYPALPCPPRDPRFTDTYTVTTHLIPAAFPRASPFVPVPALPDHESKDERNSRVQRYLSELLSLQAQHEPDRSGTQPTVLWTALNRYVRTDNGDGLTLLVLHPNGLHKEVSPQWRPVRFESLVLTIVDVRAHIPSFIASCGRGQKLPN